MRLAIPLFFLLLISACLSKQDRVRGYKGNLDKSKAVRTSNNYLQIQPSYTGVLQILETTPQHHPDSLKVWAREGLLGGLLVKGISLDSFIEMKRELMERSPHHLWFATDEIVNLNNQFSDLQPFPNLSAISAISDKTIIADIHQHFAAQCKALGIQMVFGMGVGKVVLGDTVGISDKYTDQSYLQLRWAEQRQKALAQEGIMTFVEAPTHKVWSVQDSSYIINRSEQRQLAKLLSTGINGIVDLRAGVQLIQGATDSPSLVVRRLKKGHSPSAYLQAGTDYWISNESPRTVHERIIAGELNKATRLALDAKVDKAWNLQAEEIGKTYATFYDGDWLFCGKAPQWQSYRLQRASLNLANNPQGLLPFKDIREGRFGLIEISPSPSFTFRKTFGQYAPYSYRHVKIENGLVDLEGLEAAHQDNRTLVIQLSIPFMTRQKHGILIRKINEWASNQDVVVVNFGDALSGAYFSKDLAFLQAFEELPTYETLAAQVLFGGATAEGHLPLSMSGHLTFGRKISYAPIRLGYSPPEAVGIEAFRLSSIDAIMNGAIARGATPGGQILVIKSGQVIYDKAFGHHAYDQEQVVQKTDLYDIASVSKVSATTLAMMRLYDDGLYKLTDKYKKHVACGDKASVKNIRIKDLLAHKSNLPSHPPIARFLNLRDTMPEWSNFFTDNTKVPNTIPVSKDMYLFPIHQDSLWQDLFKTPKIRRWRKFLYSDVNFVLLQKMIESRTRKGLDAYLSRTFFQPMGLFHTTYNPLSQRKPFSLTQIVPTVDDKKWRKQLVHGYVHDEFAALLGGVAGNAGIFSNAHDLGVLFQMLLNKGHYGGQQFLSKSTIELFTRSGHGNHRGLGFDKPTSKANSSLSKLAPKSSFGHTGFTGTCVWADPENELIFVFLSNRVHPDPKNRKLNGLQVRSRIHSIIYESLDSFNPAQLRTAPLEKAADYLVSAERYQPEE